MIHLYLHVSNEYRKSRHKLSIKNVGKFKIIGSHKFLAKNTHIKLHKSYNYFSDKMRCIKWETYHLFRGNRRWRQDVDIFIFQQHKSFRRHKKSCKKYLNQVPGVFE